MNRVERAFSRPAGAKVDLTLGAVDKLSLESGCHDRPERKHERVGEAGWVNLPRESSLARLACEFRRKRDCARTR
jgi:hypothetical protein